ncbi:hypothetical protein SAV14893_097730 [Streptomyces avermitilis]|uniref:Uncharacterized protein n=1 Tax=Streptomyces avermitilis TaxID=33903 RepID=A0A4D4MEI7_STRAX|nr:hypothetical protein [Streptomyces avermitilis]GDY70380.1 hypothetical protein SAV14893_097730 [Streptomyces avermitilis]
MVGVAIDPDPDKLAFDLSDRLPREPVAQGEGVQAPLAVTAVQDARVAFGVRLAGLPGFAISRERGAARSVVMP